MKRPTHRSAQGSAVFTVVMPPSPLHGPGIPEPLLTEKQVAAFLNVSTRHLYSWRMAGFIPHFKIGRAVRFRLSEVEKALESMRAIP